MGFDLGLDVRLLTESPRIFGGQRVLYKLSLFLQKFKHLADVFNNYNIQR